MNTQIIDGKKMAKDIKAEIKAHISALAQSDPTPTLAVIIVGQDAASHVYVNNKKKACAYTGIASVLYELPELTLQVELTALIDELNHRQDIHGILVQLPLPAHINADEVLGKICMEKDVDGFHPMNVGKMFLSESTIKPCTPAGIIEMLKRSGQTISGKHCVVVGRSNIVGKPAAMLLLAENATVTICHSKTKNLGAVCRNADILIAAVGKPRFITADMLKDGAVVIDVGVHRMEDNTLCGDVDFEPCMQKASFITPVPGGVGPMTIAMLMKNCMAAYRLQNQEV